LPTREPAQTARATASKYALPHYNLGVEWQNQFQWVEAVAEYKKAIALDPRLAVAHDNLGVALAFQHRTVEAIAEYRQAIAQDPKLASPHYNLGVALRDEGEWEEAIAEYRRALVLDPRLAPRHAKAHGVLAHALLQQGEFTEAKQASRRCLNLLPANHPFRAFASRQLRQCEEMLALEPRLGAILRGEAPPASATEQVNVAELCRLKRQYAAAARFYAEAFAAEPKLADDLETGHRHNAACAAALAVAAQGLDTAKPDTTERARLRKQALGAPQSSSRVRKVCHGGAGVGKVAKWPRGRRSGVGADLAFTGRKAARPYSSSFWKSARPRSGCRSSSVRSALACAGSLK
jgi:tetratricopeptide (TPR) repeat protein